VLRALLSRLVCVDAWRCIWVLDLLRVDSFSIKSDVLDDVIVGHECVLDKLLVS